MPAHSSIAQSYGAELCELAGSVGVRACLEFMPFSSVRDLRSALAVVADVGHPAAAVLVDLLHLVRSGGSVADLVGVDPALLPYAQDLARELNDQAPLTSTTTRLTNLYRDSGLELDHFLELVLQARAITQERTGSIRTARPEGWGAKPKMSYWFAVLEDLLGQRLLATGTADG